MNLNVTATTFVCFDHGKGIVWQKDLMLKVWSQAFYSKVSCILLCQVNNRGSFV